VAFVELQLPVLARALDPFPLAVRTLDALHLATVEFLRARGQPVEIASYDERLNDAARRLGIPVAAL
jgi:predicted nucleic acid-binding protein